MTLIAMFLRRPKLRVFILPTKNKGILDKSIGLLQQYLWQWEVVVVVRGMVLFLLTILLWLMARNLFETVLLWCFYLLVICTPHFFLFSVC